MSLEQLKACDVWGLGMIIFLLLNPDLEFPYQYELDQVPQKNFASLRNELVSRFKQRILPTWSSKYSRFQATIWREIEAIFSQCAHFCSRSRPSVQEVVQLFQVAKINPPRHDIPLLTSQSTAIERHDRLVAVGDIPTDQDIPDDATNSCAFLSILVTELIAGKGSDWHCRCSDEQWYALSSEIDKIILTQPTRFNPIRDVTRLYDVSEAYTLPRKANILSRDLDFHEEIITSNGVFSKDGRDALLKAVNTLATACAVTNVAIYSCDCYIFVIGCHDGNCFLLDTHPMSKQLGGVGTGLLKVYPAQEWHSASHLCSFVWKRLDLGGVGDESQQSFLVS